MAAVDPSKLFNYGLGGAAALGVAIPLVHHGLDLAKTMLQSKLKPSWDMMGQARLYGQHGGDVRYVKAQEQLIKGMYELPYNIISKQAENAGATLFGTPGNIYNKFKREKGFDALLTDPSVQAMGVEQARSLYREVAELAPDVVRKAPHTVIPAIQNALITGSDAIDPAYAANLSRVQMSLSQI